MSAVAPLILVEKLARLVQSEADEDEIFSSMEKHLKLKGALDLNTVYNGDVHVFKGCSALSLAIRKEYKKIYLKILPFYNKNQFILDLTSGTENLKYAEMCILYLSELSSSELSGIKDSDIINLIQEWRTRKLIALFSGAEGSSLFYNIEWALEGYRNFLYISKIYNNSIFENGETVLKDLKNTNILTNEEIKLLDSSFKEVIRILNKETNIALLSKPEEVFPVFIGTEADGMSLHAEGFVIFDDYYLFVERSSNQPGIQFYAGRKDLKKEEAFLNFIKEALESSDGNPENALSFERYTNETTAHKDQDESRRLTDIKKFISMSKQAANNCTIASTEGMFLACLCCFFYKSQKDWDESIKMIDKISIHIEKLNKTIEIKKLIKNLKDLNNLSAFMEKIKEALSKNNLLTDELNLFIDEFLKSKQNALPEASSSKTLIKKGI